MNEVMGWMGNDMDVRYKRMMMALRRDSAQLVFVRVSWLQTMPTACDRCCRSLKTFRSYVSKAV